MSFLTYLILLMICGSISSQSCDEGNTFKCSETPLVCIPYFWVCDGEADCQNGADEEACTKGSCSDEQFQCGSGACVEKEQKCDGKTQCQDGSDEMDCTEVSTRAPSCSEYEFQCRDGTCIVGLWVCDGESDCQDSSDEAECGVTTTSPTTSSVLPKDEGNATGAQSTEPSTTDSYAEAVCNGTDFRCSNGRCIYRSWVCDGFPDCLDAGDELNCSDVTTASPTTSSVLPKEEGNSTVAQSTEPSTTDSYVEAVCDGTDFRCSHGRCIYRSWVCDGFPDCPDGDDELNCTGISSTVTSPSTVSSTPTQSLTDVPESHSCPSTSLLCGSGECLPYHWKCDGKFDCLDQSDEMNCERETCPDGYFRCDSGRCIWQIWVCDGSEDCENGTDELNCTGSAITESHIQSTTTSTVNATNVSNENCRNHDISCGSGICISRWYACDGNEDCDDGRDEMNCPECRDSEFRCDSGRCIFNHWVCDGEADCKRGEDEANCSSEHANTIESASTALYPIGSNDTVLCKDDEFECSPSYCIPVRWRCDGEEDCQNGYDELDCEISTSSEHPLPSDRTTAYTYTTTENVEEMETTTEPIYIPFDSMGSGSKNAETTAEPIYIPFDSMGIGSVEPTKSPRELEFSTTIEPAILRKPLYPCLRNFVNCDITRCIPPSRICDGATDCQDGTDEINCNELKCEGKMHYCSPMKECLPDSVLCNRVADCPDLSDERNCGKRNCSHHEFQCVTTKHCIFDKWLCDGEKDCLDNSDEINCDLGGRSLDQFDCKDGTFIPVSFKCDGAYDCYNGLDEYSCENDEKETTTTKEYCTTLEEFLSKKEDCPSGFESFGADCIHISAYPRTWRQAQEACSNITAELASFQHRCAVERFLGDFIKQKGLSNWNYWIGSQLSLGTNENVIRKDMEIPAWFTNGEMCEHEIGGTNDVDCYYLDHENAELYLSTSCDAYAGSICKYVWN